MAGLRVPLSTLRPHRCRYASMTRGSGDWLGLPRTALSSATPRRFSTAHKPFGQTILGARGRLAPGPHLTRYRENPQWPEGLGCPPSAEGLDGGLYASLAGRLAGR